MMHRFTSHPLLTLLLMVALSPLMAGSDCADAPQGPANGLDLGHMDAQEDMGAAIHDMSAGPVYDLGHSGVVDMGATPEPDMFAHPSDMAASPVFAHFTISQTHIAFARATPGYEQTRAITIRHDGEETITLAPLFITGDWDPEALSASWARKDGSRTNALDDVVPVESGEAIELVITHRTSERDELAEALDATLSLTSVEDPFTVTDLEVLTEVDAPCLDVMLPWSSSTQGQAYRLELGELNAASTSFHGFSVVNCGPSQPVELVDVYISRDPHGILSLPDDWRKEVDDLTMLLPGESSFIEVMTTLGTEPLQLDSMSVLGQMTMFTDAKDLGTFEVNIQTLPRTRTCPMTRARVALADDMEQASLTELQTEPLKTVRLEAHIEDPAQPTPLDTVWSIIAAPIGSHARLQEVSPPGQTTSGDPALWPRQLFLDVPGDYIIELGTFERGADLPCYSERVTINATPTQDLFITTTWDTPLDPDPADRQGSDVDLHYLHPNGSFEDEFYDIFWRNQSADWGEPGSQDDPVLLRDDRDGLGPEVIAHDTPETGQVYSIGVHYFNPAGFGESYVSTTIHVRGQLTATSIAQLLPTQGAYLKVGEVTWDTMPQVRIDNILGLMPPE